VDESRSWVVSASAHPGAKRDLAGTNSSTILCAPPNTNRDTVSPLLLELAHALDADGIRYCQWKKSTVFHTSPQCANELDLLVERSDVQRFAGTLARLGFKQVLSPEIAGLPGCLVYYAFDVLWDAFVHIDVHYQLLIGHDRSKNYHLAMEKAFLNSAVEGRLFKVPAAEFEFVVFVLRMVLKHATWDSCLAGEGELSAAERQELALLEAQADPARARSVLEEHLPGVDPALFTECLRALKPGLSAAAKAWVGLRLESQLETYSRHSRPAETLLKQCRRLGRAMRRRIAGLPKKRLVTGGAVIAVVGGDGSGKSTAVHGLWEWLAPDFDAVKVHLGKPPWTWTTFAVRGLLKLASSIPGLARLAGGTEPGQFPVLLKNVCTARDRYRAYLKARRVANRSGIVVCDRFPLPKIRMMDGPRSDPEAHGERWGALRMLLARLERRWYRKIAPPDVVCLLRIDPRLAALRKVEEDPVSVQARCSEIWDSNCEYVPGRTHVVDASRSKREVLLELKQVLWSAL
jgi:thymidylate kinase